MRCLPADEERIRRATHRTYSYRSIFQRSPDIPQISPKADYRKSLSSFVGPADGRDFGLSMRCHEDHSNASPWSKCLKPFQASCESSRRPAFPIISSHRIQVSHDMDQVDRTLRPHLAFSYLTHLISEDNTRRLRVFLGTPRLSICFHRLIILSFRSQVFSYALFANRWDDTPVFATTKRDVFLHSGLVKPTMKSFYRRTRVGYFTTRKAVRRIRSFQSQASRTRSLEEDEL